MPTKTIALAAALALAVSGGAFAQSSTGKGGTGGTTDSASPMRNNTGDSMRPTTGAGSTGTMAPGATTGSTVGGAGKAPGGTMGGGAGSAGGGNSAAGR